MLLFAVEADGAVRKNSQLNQPTDFLFMFLRPGKTRFREKWLKDIIESKIRLMDSVKF